MPEVGSIIAGKYRIVRQIGAGGMGTVVAATHVQLGTRVALKFLSERVKDRSSSLERFTREARACAQLRSEHVCRVSDFGLEGDVPYIAMELLEGTDLAKLLDGGALDAATATGYVLQACAGLAEAHALGIVHRDLKPHNLFLARRPDGSPLVKVLDFGIAKIPVGDDHALTRTAHVVGSPGYMAPEQLRSSKTVDARTDVWALGVILYELISKRHPFYADAVTEIALKIAMDEPPPLTEAPPGLQAVVMRCLAKEPDNRFSDVAVLATALAPFASRGEESAAAIGRVLAESAETGRTMPQLPATIPEPEPEPEQQHATVRDSPRARQAETTHQASAGEVTGRRPRQRRIAIGISAVAAIGALGVAFALGRSSNDDEAEAVVVDEPSAPPSIDATVMVELEITVTGVPTATIIVGGENWGDGTRISRPVVVDGLDKQIQIKIGDELRYDGFVEVKPSDKPIKHVIDLATTLADSGSQEGAIESTIKRLPIEPDAPKTEYEAARRDAARAHSARVAKGLLVEDLGNHAGDEDAIAAALGRKDLVAARARIAALNAAVAEVTVDRDFMAAKLQRIAKSIVERQLKPDQYAAMSKLTVEATNLFAASDFAGANRKINLVAVELATKPLAQPAGSAGSGVAGSGSAGSGAAGSGSAGSGAVGSGSAGSGAGSGSAGSQLSPTAGSQSLKAIPRTTKTGSQQQPTARNPRRETQLEIDSWLSRIRMPGVSPITTLAACKQLMMLDANQVPWDTCILAQCSFDPAGLPLLLVQAPLTISRARKCPAASGRP